MRRTTTCSILVCLAALVAVPQAAAQATSEQIKSIFRDGKAAMASGDYRRALSHFEEIARLLPGNTKIYLDIGSAKSAMQDWDGALAAYEKVLTGDPDNAKAHNNIGNVQFRRGEFVPAAAAYRRAVAIDPDYLLAWFHLGWIARQEGNDAEAEQAFARCLELPPRSPRDQATIEDARFYLGALRFRAKDYASAARLMEQVVSFRPQHDEAHYYLGQSYLRLGRQEQARQHLNRVLELAPGSRTAVQADELLKMME